MEKFIKTIIQDAGKILRKGFRKELFEVKQRATSKKAAHKYDKIIDEFLIKKISEKYPNHNFLTEESGFIEKRAQAEYLWVIDSLDGTGNFANSNPLFSVCVAVYKKNKPYMGAVYVPMADELFFAKVGKGAYLNNKRIKVSEIQKLSESYGIYCEGGLQNKIKFSSILKEIHPRVKDLRKLGSAGIETSWVACGRADFYFVTEIEPWDIAAGILLVKEAGGEVTDFFGDCWRLKKTNLIFSNNNKIHRQIKNLLKRSWKFN